jgi:hypothetical protein
MIIFTISFDPEPDPTSFSDPDTAPLKQIISDPGGSESGSTPLHDERHNILFIDF